MRFKPEAHDFVVQPDGRVFHVVPSAWSGGQTAYRVEYQERIHLKPRTEVRTYCRWPRLNQEHEREIVQALADRLEEEVRQARANTGGDN